MKNMRCKLFGHKWAYTQWKMKEELAAAYNPTAMTHKFAIRRECVRCFVEETRNTERESWRGEK